MSRALISCDRSARLLLGLVLLSATATAQQRSVAQWAQELKNSDVAVQLEAARTLSALGVAARPAVPALIEALSAQDPQVRAAAAHALGVAKPEGGPAVESLVARLADDDSHVRASAAFALGKLGDQSPPTIEALVKAALDPEAVVRREVRDALRAIKPPRELTEELWVKTLEDADPQVVLPAMLTLAELGKDAVPALRDKLSNPVTAYWACLVAAEIGPDAAELTPDLINVLQHEEPECRMEALVALGRIGSGAKGAVPAIIELLGKESFDSVKYTATFALEEIGDAAEVLPELMKLLETQDLGLRAISARGVAKLSQDPEQRAQAVKVLLEALKSDNDHIRQLVIRTLSELPTPPEGPRPEVLDAFVAAMEDAEPEVVGEVMAALAARGKAALPGILRGLANDKARPYAVHVAALLGPDAEPALPALLEAWKGTADDPELRAEIQFTLAEIGPAAAAAVPALTNSLASEDPQVRHSACYALGRIGPAAKGAVAALRKMLESADDTEQLRGIWALLKILPQDAAVKQMAVPLLMGAFEDEREVVRLEAAKSLGEIGSLARSAVPVLRKALNDESVHVREAAQAALDKIGG